MPSNSGLSTLGERVRAVDAQGMTELDLRDGPLAELVIENKRQALEIAWLAQCVRDLRGEIAQMQGRSSVRDRQMVAG